MAMVAHINGPPCRKGKHPHSISLIAPTIGDAAETAGRMPGCLTDLQPGTSVVSKTGGTFVEGWPNGSIVRLLGAHTKDDQERLRAAGNRCWVHLEEFAAMRYLTEAWDQMHLGLRLGPRPHWVLTTTPKARPDYLAVVEEIEQRDDVYVTDEVSTADNPHLPESTLDFLYDKYDGTSLGGQELHGKRIEEAEGALWVYELIEANRLDTHYTDDDEPVSMLGRVVVGVDPPGGKTECGIVAAAAIPHDCLCGTDATYPHFAVVADTSAKLTPNGWGGRVINTYQEWAADLIVGEKNYGGDMVESNIRNIDATVNYDNVTASRGKRVRAEPVKGLYEQGRVHHIGVMSELEAEMVQWVPDESSWSPNRVDALVWAITELADVGEPALWFA
jgi:phage terminase large subunit-like protein